MIQNTDRMKRTYILSFVLLALLLSSCSRKGTAQNAVLSATEFAEKIKEFPSAALIDVRTPEEFSGGHIPNARNYNWNGTEFDSQISQLDKSEPVFVYCLSGGRSASAADKMRAAGFTRVYEMEGGMLKWRSANLPEVTDNPVNAGMTREEFDTLVHSEKWVLVDFYADWCAPCQKMKPYLDEIAHEQADRVTVIRLDADANPALCNELGIDALPYLQLYKSNARVWQNKGFIDKEGVLDQLK